MKRIVWPAIAASILVGLFLGIWSVSPYAQTLQPHAFPITASATGTTGVTTATLPATTGLTNYLCGFSIRANANAVVSGQATVTGMVGGTMNFMQFVNINTTGMGNMDINFSVCLPASSASVAIAVNSIAAGTGGITSVTAWGWQIQ